MERHLRLSARLLIVLAGVNIVLCVFVYLIGRATGLLDISRTPVEWFQAAPVSGIICASILVYSLVMVLPQVLAGVAMLKMAPWAQGVATLISTFTLLVFPLGTLVGGYALWVLLADETTTMLEYQAKSDRNSLKSR